MQDNFKLFTRIQDNKHSLEALRTMTRAIEARFGERAQVKAEHKAGLINVYVKIVQHKGLIMTIEKQPQAIICDYCQNTDYYCGDKRFVQAQAKAMGWLIYKGKHFDTEQCLQNYKENKPPYELRLEDFYD